MRIFFQAVSFFVAAVASGPLLGAETRGSPIGPVCSHIVRADIVALEQAYILNRFGAFVPAGMMFALRRDVVALEKPRGAVRSPILEPGAVRLRDSKRPRPIVLRVNEGDCLEVRFTNLLSPIAEEEGGIPLDYNGRMPLYVGARPGNTLPNVLAPGQKVSVDRPRTRAASFHVTGLELAPILPEECPRGAACGGDGSNVGLPSQAGLVFNPAATPDERKRFDIGSLAHPGQTVVTRWRAKTEGAYFAYSTAAPVGGEGDGGQIGLGLFGSVNVEPQGSQWYRSQVTHDELQAANNGPRSAGHPYASIKYDAEKGGVPILAITNRDGEIVHSDLNAIIVPPSDAKTSASAPASCTAGAFGTTCGKPFREFTVMFHDEVHAEQAFAILDDENDPLHLVKDGMGINYGVSSMGSAMLATKQFKSVVGPAKDCAECRAEEFFLSSWANGDPALILSYGKDGKPNGARYPDDPSNVHHSYLGDPVRFRNLHAGPKETHVFHLHAHQWVQDRTDPNSTYLDSQTISPGATFSYAIEFGGAGNRNYTPGDSIFHCHLYPHFAQGMWELWRVHDAFTDGRPGYFDPAKGPGATNDPRGMNLPDHEIQTGTQTPALVPLPGGALAPMPTLAFRGYPFYVAGTPGHRPPQPPLDMDADDWKDLTQAPPDATKIVDGGLPRHVVAEGDLTPMDPQKAIAIGGEAARVIAQRVERQNQAAVTGLAQEWSRIAIRPVAEEGTADEQNAMKFHEGGALPGLTPVDVPNPHPDFWPNNASTPTAPSAPNPPIPTLRKAFRTAAAALAPNQAGPRSDLFFVNGLPRAQGAPYANPCPPLAPTRGYRAAFIQTELVYNKHGWFDPQGRIIILENDIKDVIDPDHRTKLPEPLFFRANSGECLDFKSSNFVPLALNADDFQIYTPTDTIGQHIHLVKFDVTSSDGSGNGFNYEDATFSPGEVRERVIHHNIGEPGKRWTLKAHPLFKEGGDIYESALGAGAPAGETSCPAKEAGEDAYAFLSRVRQSDRGFPCDPLGHRKLLYQGLCPPQQSAETDLAYLDRLNEHHPYCGAQRTTQRWWADPILNRATGKDNTLRTVFTHDHMGPSSHQQHGLYAGLVIEPANSVWTPLDVAAVDAPDPNVKALSPDDMNVAGDGTNLKCGRPEPSPLCAKLIGGSALAFRTGANPKDASASVEPDKIASIPVFAQIMPRWPLKLRDDGGPTATKANIFAPKCIGDSDSNVLQPSAGRNAASSGGLCRETHDTRREFLLAVADFGIAYNAALEPINPEPLGDSGMRDRTFIRFGMRHVATTPARPLAISSEDPGSQYFNYRNEPIALRISEGTPNDRIGGWDYKQHTRRAALAAPCDGPYQDCLGDPANALSSSAHAARDRKLALEPLIVNPATGEPGPALVNPATRETLVGTPMEGKLDGPNSLLASVERWRRNFNCALYPKELVPDCPVVDRPEPARVFGDPATPLMTTYESDPVQIRLIQGAQEAQHVFTMNAAKWRRLPGDTGDGGMGTGLVNAQPLGISEHFEFNVQFPRPKLPEVDRLYFGSSVDQLWDGLWGVMRSFRDQPKERITTLAGAGTPPAPREFLAPLAPERIEATRQAFEGAGGGGKAVICEAKNENDGHFFDVAAVKACELFDTCDGPDAGLTYSVRFGVRDEDAVVYVLEDEGACFGAACEKHSRDWQKQTVVDARLQLRKQFKSGRRLEPLALRAAAGQCLTVNFRNLLKPKPIVRKEPVEERDAYNNFLPMITDGFNVNQFAMSQSVGLSPARISVNPLEGDGSNVGLNGATILHAGGVGDEPPGADGERRQGSLLAPCIEGKDETRCKDTYTWSVAEFDPGQPEDGKAIEFGAVPLRSFGDPIQHPMHGLVGALSVGPEGSAPCAGDRFAQAVSRDGKDPLIVHGLSAEICDASGEKLYVDHILVMQDAISARRGGLPVANLAGAEEPDDYGVKGINYRTEPLWARSVNDPSVGFSDRNTQDLSMVLSSATATDGETIRCKSGAPPLVAQTYPCDPETPVLDARPGEKIRLSFVHPGGHTRQTGLAVSGHGWNPYPWSADSRIFDPTARDSLRQGVFNGFGPMMGVTFEMTAGGEARHPLDYLIRSQASFLFDGGQWGILRVR